MWSRAIINIHNLINRAAYCMLKKTITRVWNNIVGVKDDLLKTRININQVIKKQVGAGDNTLFWQDKWIGNETLKQLFPEPYKFEKHKNCKIGDKKMEGSHGSGNEHRQLAFKNMNSRG